MLPPLPQTLALTSGDILDMQSELCADLKKVVKFSRHTLYFPLSQGTDTPQLLPKEQKILLPLLWSGRQLGVLVLHEVDVKKAQPLLGILPAVSQISLEKLAQLRFARTCPLTGLYVEDTLYARMEEVAAKLQAPEMLQQDLASLPAYKLCMGVVCISLSNAEDIALNHGFSVLEELQRRLAKAFQADIGSDVLAVRLQRFSFGLLFNACGRETCRNRAAERLKVLRDINVTSPLTQEKVWPVLKAGFGFYPNDLTGGEMRLEMHEQAHLLVERVRLACEVASPGQVLGFAELLKVGGRILEVLPQGRLRLNLGRRMGVRVGQCFAVMGGGSSQLYKGEISVVRVRQKSALAEMHYQTQSQTEPQVGDRLELALNVATLHGHTTQKLPEQADFYALMQEKSQNLKVFTLSLVQLEEVLTETLEGCLLLAQQAVQDAFQTEADLLLGRHGRNILLCFHPNVAAKDLKDQYIKIYQSLKQAGLRPIIGLSGYPFLGISRSKMAELGLKALAYAQLLPEPQVGICNSLALNISADRLYSRGDLLGALDEYRLAIAADANNDLAWNSLGVCLAALGRPEEAKEHFLEALKRKPNAQQTAEIYYNLGTLWQSLGELQASQNSFEQCVQQDPEHIYAWIRLGQLLEQRGELAQAQTMYSEGAQVEARLNAGSLAKRHLAQLALSQGQEDAARICLQEALQQNPYDAWAMLNLAKIYLAGGEDPALAEMLARKSLNLQDQAEAWEVLACALKAMGQETQASQARVRAENWGKMS